MAATQHSTKLRQKHYELLQCISKAPPTKSKKGKHGEHAADIDTSAPEEAAKANAAKLFDLLDRRVKLWKLTREIDYISLDEKDAFDNSSRERVQHLLVKQSEG